MTTKTFNFAGDSTVTCVFTSTCIHCKQSNDITLDFMSYLAWYNGDALIQNIWPDLDNDQRELLISGTHAECWKEIFG